MKKNLISVVILALILANLILTAVLTISILPQTKKANELITKVCAAIDLDLEGGGSEGSASAANVSPKDQDKYNFAEDMTINLKKGADGKEHWAVISVTLVMNKKAEGYKDYGSAEALTANEGLLKDKINSIISRHTYEEMTSDIEKIKVELAEGLQELYDGSEFIYQVALPVCNYQ